MNEMLRYELKSPKIPTKAPTSSAPERRRWNRMDRHSFPPVAPAGTDYIPKTSYHRRPHFHFLLLARTFHSSSSSRANKLCWSFC